MSKVDAQRAMREARYARLRASGPTRREAAAADPSAKTPAPRTPSEPARSVAAAAATPTTATEGALCGHKSINGRACTRAAGHAEKNHRYG